MDKGEGSVVWETLGTRELLRSRVFTVLERDSLGPGGRRGRFSVLEAPDWATVVPLVRRGDEEFFLMVRQYRHGSGQLSIEFPGGIVEAGEDPAAAAARELEEETGYRASTVTLAGSVSPNPAIMANSFHAFLAEGVEPSGRVELDEHEAIDSFLVPVAEVRASMGSGQYSHALMATALFLVDRLLACRR